MVFKQWFRLFLFCGISFCYHTVTAATVPIEHWTLSNGARVYYVHLTEVPMMDAHVVFDAGSARDGNMEGLANFTNATFGEGTDSLSADEIAETFTQLGAEIDNSAARDMAMIHLRTMVKPSLLKPSVNLFSQLLTNPKLPKKNYLRIQTQLLQSVKQQEETPSTLASIALFKKIYGDTPYAHNPLGTSESISHINEQAIKKFYQQYYVGKNALLVLVGDISLDQAKEISEEIVGKLPAGEKPPALQNSFPTPKGEAIQISYPASQTAIKLGTLGINWQNPDYFPLLVGNYILGGGPLTSRLFQEVRQARGLTYSVNSGFIPMKERGPFIIALQTKNQDVNQSLDVIHQVLQQYLNKGPTPKELQMAKKHLIGNFPLTIDSNTNISANVIVIAFYGLPLNFLDTYREEVGRVTKQEIDLAFQKTIHPETFVTVTVGPKGGEKQGEKKG